jgi:UDP-N-acetylglucosamine 2-epimerase (non-hydrolysing)
MTSTRVHLIAAARPNFMKVAPLYHALARESWCSPAIVHTGQHYDANMSDAFFRDLKLPDAHFHLGVGSGSHAQQTGGVMIAYEQVCIDDRPDWIVVVGDVNSTAACALVGVKLGVRVAHLEAGLRSGDRGMPEEINRIVTDAICDLLWTPSADGDDNLRREGVEPERIERVGNIMIDSLELQRARIEADGTRASLGLQPQGYGVVTLHRPSNVDRADVLSALVAELTRAALAVPLVFAVHPRTQKQLQAFGLRAALERAPGLTLIEPLGYIPFMNLVFGARLAITDSGGLQEETTYLNIPCLTLRENTERPVTVTKGSNRLVKIPELAACVTEALSGRWVHGRRPELWDGHAAARVAASLKRNVLAHRTA